MTIEYPKNDIDVERFSVGGKHEGLSPKTKIWVFIGQYLSGMPTRYWIQKDEVVLDSDGTWNTIAYSSNQDINQLIQIVAIAIADDDVNRSFELSVNNINKAGVVIPFTALPPYQGELTRSVVDLKRVDETGSEGRIAIPTLSIPQSHSTEVLIIESKPPPSPIPPTPTLCWPPGGCK